MYKLKMNPSRKDVCDFIYSSSIYGNLCVFVGAGFSKAVLNDDNNEIALSWKKLLDKVIVELNIKNSQELLQPGFGFPEIATRICRSYSTDNNISYEEASKIIKTKLSSLTSWYPINPRRDQYAAYLNELIPSLIITTNYDMVIECLLPDNSIPLGPYDSISSPEGSIPVFHMHGLRTNPEGIIILQEDYISLFRPTEYRQIKLALTLRESTTLVLGYGLNDVNVLTALDWSKNVFNTRGGISNYPNDIIQIIRKEAPMEMPYRDTGGILVLETKSLPAFFEEYIEVKKINDENRSKEKQRVAAISKALYNPDSNMINNFIDDQTFRKNLLSFFLTNSMPLLSNFVVFIAKCIDETWQRSAPRNAFEAYNDNLKIILDVLTAFPFEHFPPVLLQKMAVSLDNLGPYIGPEDGQSWAAFDTWKSRKNEIPKEMNEELIRISKQYNFRNLLMLLGG